MKKGFTFIILLLLVILPISTVSAQKNRRVTRTQKIQKPVIQKTESEFGTTQAFTEGSGVYLKWTTKAEKAIGFMVFRVTPNGKQPINGSFVPGNFLQTRQASNDGTFYNFFDETGDLNSTYVIESYDENGRTVISEPFNSKQVSSLREIAGESADHFLNAERNKTPSFESLQPKLQSTSAKQKGARESLSNPTVHRSVMAMPGVKIGVKKDGFYRVSRAELLAAGFDVNANPNQWQLFLEGEELAINVEASGNYIEFVGKGIDILESDTRIYNLVVGSGNGKRMVDDTTRPQGSGLGATGFYSTFVKKERVTYAGGILNGDNQNYFGTPITSSGGTVNFNMEALDFAAGKSTMEITVQGLSQTSHQIQVTLNGESLFPIEGNGQVSMTQLYSVPITTFVNGNNTLQFTGIPGSVSLVDTISIEFIRLYSAKDNQLAFYNQAGTRVTLSNFTSPNIRAFNLSNPLEPKRLANVEIVPINTGYGITILPTTTKDMIAVEDTGALTVASITQNTPSTLSATTNGADLLIISHGNFMAQSENWAAYRRGQGFDVDVINVEDVFDEFGFCVPSANAVRSFLQYASTNWQTTPDYVLLIGDATYDGRNYQGLGFFNFVPTKFVDTIYTEVPSDEALADFDNDGLSELAIGRIPVRTPQAVTNVLNKTIAFESDTANNMNRGALFASDLPNGYDFEGLSQRLADQLPANMPKTYINRALTNAQTLLIADMNNGRFLVNYSGHGNAADWASSSFFSRANVPSLVNTNLSIFTLLTCLNGYFVPPSAAQESLSERLLSSTVGGGVAVWSSTGLTTPDIQEVMATRFYLKIAQGGTPRLGDLIKDAKTTIIGGRDVRMSWGLLGDPMLKVR